MRSDREAGIPGILVCGRRCGGCRYYGGRRVAGRQWWKSQVLEVGWGTVTMIRGKCVV